MPGKVYLVGCGPGAPDLLTVRAVNVMKDADVILYDRLLDERILNNAEKAEKINVGKKPGEADKQEWINDLLYSKAEEGKTVVRLKNGNPVIFARGGEELEYLQERGVDVEIVPGLSSATSLAPLVGLPLTKRDVSSSLSILTGVGKGGKNPSWENVCETAVVLMTVSNLPKVVEKLTESKMGPDTLGVLISSGSAHEERVLVSQLFRIADMSEFAGIEPPSILVAGDVVRELLNVRGRSVAAFRPVRRRERTEEIIRKGGGEPRVYGICEPNITSKDDLIDALAKNWNALVFMSPTSVETLEGFIDFSKIKAVAVGNTTAQTLKERGVKEVVVPEKKSAEGVQNLLKEKNWKVLAFRSALSDQDLKGAENIVSYKFETVDITETLDDYLEDIPDFTLLTSAGMLKVLLEKAGEEGKKSKFVESLNESFILSLGRKCSTFAESQGVKINYEFPEPNLESFFVGG